MYSFINDLSISPAGFELQNNWNLIDAVMEISYKLREYKIEILRVPSDFLNRSIAGSRSIADYLADSQFDPEKKTLLYEFIGNRIEEPDDEINATLTSAQENRLINVYHKGNSSDLLTEAHVMKCPALSFESGKDFQVDFLDSELAILNENNEITAKSIRIENIFNENSFHIHHAFLIDWKKKIVFVKTKWDPIKKPIWNDLTEQTIDELEFPKSIHGKSDKKEELRRIGTLVAEMNAWVYDENITKKNRNASQMRKIFRSDSGSKTAYLSIDFENAYGGFEVHDHKGTHQGQIDFKGAYNKKSDLAGHHDIVI